MDTTLGLTKGFIRAYHCNDACRRYEVLPGDRGFIFYEPFHQRLKDNDAVSGMIPAGTTVEYGNQAVSQIIIVDRKHLQGVILRPLDQYVDPDTINAQSTLTPPAENWDFQDTPDGSATEAVQPDSEDEEGNALTSTWQWGEALCPNGFFKAGFKRQAKSKTQADDDRTADNWSSDSYITIQFGGTPGPGGPLVYKWMLLIPMSGRPLLFQNNSYVVQPPGYGSGWPSWIHCPWTDGQLSEVTAESLSGEGKTFTIGVIGHALCVSESKFEDSFAYFMVDTPQPVIPAGEILLTAWPGQCTMRLHPMEFQIGDLYRYSWWVEDINPGGPPPLGEDGLPDIGQPGPWQLGDLWGEQYLGLGYASGGAAIMCYAVDGYPGYLTYDLTLYPITYGGQAGQSTPFCESALFMQCPTITDNGDPGYAGGAGWPEIPLPFELTSGEELGNQRAQIHELTVDNEVALMGFGEGGSSGGSFDDPMPNLFLREGRPIRLEGGRLFTDDSEDVWDWGTAWIVEGTRDPLTMPVQVTDLLGMLSMSEWSHGALCLRNMDAQGMMRFLLHLQGIGDDWIGIGGINNVLSAGQCPDNEGWMYEDGAKLVDILSDIARYGLHNQELFYDRATDSLMVGCRYCHAQLDDAVGDPLLYYMLHQDNGWMSSGCRAHDFARTTTASYALYPDDGIDLHCVFGANTAWADIPGLGMQIDYARRWQATECILRENEYANVVTAWGPDRDGRRIGWMLRNDEAIYSTAGTPDPYSQFGAAYVGWPIGRTDQLRGTATIADVQARVGQMGAESFPRQWLLRNVEIPFNNWVRAGMTMMPHGGNAADLDGRCFRITRVQHSVKQRTTTLDAREMVGYNGATGSSS